MENEDKKVDTQTTGNDAQEINNKQDTKLDAAFGNTENNNSASNQNKSEGEKGKKANTIAQKNDDGSITFKNQDELDGFIARKYAQGAQKATQGETSKQKQEKEPSENSEGEKEITNEQQNQQNAIPDDYYENKIALALAKRDVNPKKLERASRLVNQKKVIVDGNIDDVKLDEEINAIISEFPELIVGTNGTSDEQKGFKFGATGNQTQDATNINDEIDSIFGNK